MKKIRLVGKKLYRVGPLKCYKDNHHGHGSGGEYSSSRPQGYGSGSGGGFAFGSDTAAGRRYAQQREARLKREALEKKRKEIANDKTLTNKEKIEKQKEINNAAEVLHFRNELAEFKQIYKTENENLKAFETKAIMLNNKLRSGKGHSAKDIMDIAAMTDAQYNYLA